MTSSFRPATGVVVGLGVLYLLALAVALGSSGSEFWTVLVVAPILMAVSWPVLAVVSRRLDLPWLLPLAMGALCVKLVAALVRYWTAFEYYGGLSDAAGYHTAGVDYSVLLRMGVLPELPNELIGTPFIGLLTGIVYAFSLPSVFVGYLVFSWIGFWGLLLAVMAYVKAFPEGHAKRYAVLALFLPSLLFWPSGLGKEAWMMFGVGLAMFGAAVLLTGRLRGLVPLVIGLWATSMVRPHVTALLVGALLIALIVRPSRRRTPLTPVVKGITVVAAAGLLVFAVQSAAEFVGIEDLDPTAVKDQLETRTENTAAGGSEFEGAFTTSVTGIPWALVTVILRPFPHEAGGFLPLLSSLEGLLLLFLLWRFGRPLLRLPRYLRRHPYVTFCVCYVLFYAVVFSGFSNFGILVRQRSLVLPAFLVLVALPTFVTTVRTRDAETTEQSITDRREIPA